MAAVFPGIYDIIDKNPHKHSTIALRRDATNTTAQSFERWESFVCKPLQPPGPLSMLLWHFDPMYSMGTPALRKQIETEKLLELQERVDKELVGRRWPRKKIQDALAAQVSASTPPATPLLEEVLCELFQIQKISISRKSKRILFFPPDLRNWTSERTILLGDDDNCWMYEAEQPLSVIEWIQQKEQEGWKIQWPTADGTLEQLKATLTQRHLTAHVASDSTSSKPKKEDYARAVGRAEAISTLQGLHLRIQ